VGDAYRLMPRGGTDAQKAGVKIMDHCGKMTPLNARGWERGGVKQLSFLTSFLAPALRRDLLLSPGAGIWGQQHIGRDDIDVYRTPKNTVR
jgi:hypothetical protein